MVQSRVAACPVGLIPMVVCLPKSHPRRQSDITLGSAAVFMLWFRAEYAIIMQNHIEGFLCRFQEVKLGSLAKAMALR